LRARGAEKKGYAKYVVLDDFRNKLHPKLINGMDKYEATYRMQYGLDPGSKETVSVDAILKEKAPWETNAKCLKSLRYQPPEKKN